MWYFSATVWLTSRSPRSAAIRRSSLPGTRAWTFSRRRGSLVPSGMPAGSDTANLSVFGYDPKIYYSGRSPLEAASMGIPLAPEDVTYRCNFVTLSDADNIENAVMIDYSADDISNEEAHELIAAIAPLYAAAGCELHAGFRYRHCLVLRAAASGAELTPPHDITGKPVAGHLPR